jgi:PAS domain S-box-containing protein
LIEDNPGDARLVSEALIDADSVDRFQMPELNWVAELTEGLKQLQAEPVDVVLLDLSLPDSHGLPTVSRVKEQFPNVPVVVLTGLRDEFVAVEALHIGAQDYLVKSQIDGPMLLRSIRYALERVRTEQQLRDSNGRLQDLVTALRKSEEQYKDLFENANDLVCTLDAYGYFTSVNKKWETLLGYQRHQLLGRDLLSFVAPRSADVARRLVVEANAAGAAPVEVEFLCSSGATVPLEVGIRTIHGFDSVVGIQCIMRDVRERRKFEERLAQAQKMEAVGRLAGGIAHDFNNLLTVVSGNTQVLLSTLNEDDPNRTMLVQIDNAANRAADLTRQLLLFSRKQITETRVIDVNVVVQGLKKLLQRLLTENIAFSVSLAPELATVRGDYGQIEQVIMNLALNARDAMPEGGNLLIEVRNISAHDADTYPDVPAGEYVMISVSDSGVGMDRDTQSRAFEPFFTTKDVGKGTGLGLATVYAIVKNVKGHVSVSSELQKGSAFRVFLPRTTDLLKESRRAARAGGAKGTETVLLVEDDVDVRAVVEELLTRSGYTVLTATDPNDALELADRYYGDIHLLITDIVMPVMNGRDLYLKVKELRQDIRSLFISGYSDIAFELGDPQMGCAAFLQKPFTADVVRSKVREVLDSVNEPG